MTRLAVKWMDEKGNEVKREKATYALVTEYDEEGDVINETFGQLGDRVEEHAEK